MKDPLQQEATAYEILQIEENATEADINAAFKAASRRGNNAVQLTRARQALKEPADRAIVDLLLYDPDSLRTLSPSPLNDPSVLDVPKRAATAAAWEEHLRNCYPDYRAAHSLAVLWYWWALYESDLAMHPPQAAHAVNPPDPVALWKAAAASWAMLAASEDFWEARPRVSPDLAAKLAVRMERMLRERFDSLATYHRDQGQVAEAERYRSLDLTFTTELRTARALVSSGIRVRGSPVCSGPVLLERLGLRDQVARELDAALARDPGNADLRRVRDALSPYGHISALIEEGQAGEALGLIAALPRQARGTEEVVSLEARALTSLGAQDAELGRVDDAIDQWAQALQIEINETQEVARHAIVTTIRQRAAALSGKDDEQAIALLERGHRLTSDPGLRSTLAELLARRGIDTMNRAGEQASGACEVTAALKKELKQGMSDLERAAELGSATAPAQLESARNLMGQISVQDEIGQANQAAEQGNWDTVVTNLQSAVQTLGDQAPQELRQNLAVALANRNAECEVDAANRATGHGDWDTAVAKLRSAVLILGDQAPQELRQNLAVALANRANKNAEPAMSVVVAARQQNPADLGAALATVQQEYRAERRRSPKHRILQVFVLAGAAALWWWVFSVQVKDLSSGSRLDTLGRALQATFVIVLGLIALRWVYGVILAPIGRRWKHFWAISQNFGTQLCEVCDSRASYEVKLGAAGATTPLCYSHASALESAAGRMPITSDPFTLRRVSQMLEGPEADLREAATLAPGLDGVRESIRQLGELRSRLGLPGGR